MTRGDERSHERFQEALGRTIKVMRAERGMTQQQLAEEAGISRSYLNQLERGTRSSTRGGASTDIIARLAQALGEDPSSFLAAVQEREAAGPYDRTKQSRRRPLDAKRPWLLEQQAHDEVMEAPSQVSYDPLPNLPRHRAGPPVGSSRAQALREFEMLLPYLSADDLEIVLGMMRRLAGQR